MPDLPNVTVTVTSRDGVSRVIPCAGVVTTSDVEWDEFPQADGSTLAVPRA